MISFTFGYLMILYKGGEENPFYSVVTCDSCQLGIGLFTWFWEEFVTPRKQEK